MTLNSKALIKQQSINSCDSDFNIFGDFEELHNRIVGAEDNFNKSIDRIKWLVDREENIKITIGLSRYNFARLNKIAEFCMSLLGKKVDLSLISLKIFPVKDLPQNFINYLEEIKKHIDSEKIDIIFYDDKLMEILKKVSLHAQANPGKKKIF